MADWYVSSVAYAAIAPWAASTAYTVGMIVRQLATPAVGSERAWRCTTAGTTAATEPTWTLGEGTTTTSGTAVFTEVTGNGTWMGTQGSTATWLCPGPRLDRIMRWGAAADRIFVSSDHAETQSTAMTLPGAANDVPYIIICVSRTSTNFPPTAAQVTTGATVTTTGASNIAIQGPATTYNNQLWQGISFVCGTGATAASINISSDTVGRNYLFKNCTFRLATTAAGSVIKTNAGEAWPNETVWDNCTVQFGAVDQKIDPCNYGCFIWQNTASALAGAIFPTILFTRGVVILRGVDLSALGSGKSIIDVANAASANGPCLVARNCRLNASVTIPTDGFSYIGNDIELHNCDSGDTGYKSTFQRFSGIVTTETTIIRSNGASNGVQAYSYKYVSNANAGHLLPLFAAPIYLWNTVIGSAQTLRVEIISSGTLNEADIWVEVESLSTSGFPQSVIANDGPATPITATTAQTTSSTTWAASPATPVKQALTVSFTAQEVGLVAATVYLAKASTTVYVDPLVTVT